MSEPKVDDTEDILSKLEKYQLQLRQHSQTCSEVGAASVSSEGISVLVVEEPCSICAMLTQSQSPEIAIRSGSLVVAVPTERAVDEILQPLYLPREHLARGPPVC